MEYQERESSNEMKERKKIKKIPPVQQIGANKKGPKTTPFPPLQALSAAAPAEKRIQLSPGTRTKPSRTKEGASVRARLDLGGALTTAGGTERSRAVAARGRRVEAAVARGSRAAEEAGGVGIAGGAGGWRRVEV
jgi:hypothetical protein